VRGVHVVLGTPRPYLLATEARLPVYVANGTPNQVRVEVVLRPKSGRLQVDHPVPVLIAPNTARRQVLVPVEALSSGDVQIAASVRTPEGELLGGGERELTIRVRREWETRGILIAGAVLGALLVVGLLRGVRRDRSRVPPEDVPDVDDMASAAGDRAAARMDALDPDPVAEPDPEAGADGPTDGGENDGSGQFGQQDGPVTSDEVEDGDVRDARGGAVMSRENR